MKPPTDRPFRAAGEFAFLVLISLLTISAILLVGSFAVDRLNASKELTPRYELEDPVLTPLTEVEFEQLKASLRAEKKAKDDARSSPTITITVDPRGPVEVLDPPEIVPARPAQKKETETSQGQSGQIDSPIDLDGGDKP